MKILLVTDNFPPEKTVVGTLVYESAQELIKRGYEVIVLTTSSDIPSFPYRPRVGVYNQIKVYTLPRLFRGELAILYATLWNPFVIREFRSIIRQEQPDVVHAHNIHQYLTFSILSIARQFGSKVFLTSHDVRLFHYGKLDEFIDKNNINIPNTFDYRVHGWQQIKRFKKWYNPFRRSLIRHYLKSANKIFTVSEALREALRQNGIHNTFTLHNALDVKAWQSEEVDPKAFKEQYGLQGKKIIFFGGRLSGAKGGEQLIAAFRKLAEKVPEAVLLIVGAKNKYLEHLLSVNEDLKNSGCIVVTGWLQKREIHTALAASDVVAFPSICFDTFGMINLEAMASGTPVVATCFGGSPEVVKDGVTGYVVNPFDVQTFAEKMSVLLTDNVLAASFGEAGRQRALKDFSLSVQTDLLIKKYQE